MGDMYIAIDGDSVGIRLQQLILEERLEELKSFSNSIHDTLFSFVEVLEKHGAVVYMHGGTIYLQNVPGNARRSYLNM